VIAIVIVDVIAIDRRGRGRAVNGNATVVRQEIAA
jgi:hypothetical protein